MNNKNTYDLPTEWKKIFANHLYNKGFVSGIYKDHLQFNSKRQILNLNTGKDLNRHFFKEDIQLAHKKTLYKISYQIISN